MSGAPARDPTGAPVERCAGCGLAVAGGEAGCQVLLDGLWGLEFGNALYFRTHRLTVDVYALQHPERYCVSAKSLAAHLMGTCAALERGAGRAVGDDRLRRWLDGPARIERPALPAARGRLTVADVVGAAGPEAHHRAVDAWARATWEAYAPLHAVARGWIDRALSRGGPERNAPARTPGGRLKARRTAGFRAST